MRRMLTSGTLLAALVLAGTPALAAPQLSAPRQSAAQPVRAVTQGFVDVCNFTKTRPILKLGSSGSAVRQAQCYLNHSLTGRDLAVDGQFGPVTQQATLRFQRCAGIGVDGVIGAQTWSFLVFWANSPKFVC
ncbi:peptidoglycan-binding domain-containing protein [Streptomyces sp. DSM 15324]|uniref:peptidoglycan-binding domain-containing protein n=1 Tax=Streptomyces sp. DSM 15324 TaxID=1739111 RepID=UPI00131BB72B|nr:peptidoglycan-binding domain-containing protein [Streptomyces sp. DSM 15324]